MIKLCNINQQNEKFVNKILIQFFLSSTCFERHVSFIRKTICTCTYFGGMFPVRLCKQSSKWKDVFDAKV